ncbi:MFS transporter [Azotobacter chroococcum]|uniref:Putative tartrate transporter n=1 Tax=Azotobacter chroococcum TaxID=353 RepID=A0AAP9YH85_9GAMM|nr:MFS transporter [Azotobacter chroococcum]QQE91352.1 MFS transporter [Azotobacter chroococcum]
MAQAVEELHPLAQTHSRDRKIIWRLMPLLLICYVFANLDRINIGFAKLQMSQDLGFSNTVYGLGAGIFFLSYMLFGVPSSLMLERLGPRRWIAIIMVVWGFMSAGMFLVENVSAFYILRFLLGAAEAGFFPGILLYINRWYPARRRAQMTALFALAVPMAGVLGGPLSGWILQYMQDAGGLRGWQWMFILEGMPVVLLGLVVLKTLPDHFEQVTWLDAEEKVALRAELSNEESHRTMGSLGEILRNPHLWMLVAIYCAVMLAVNTINYWMPSLIHAAGVQEDLQVGLLSAIPYLAGCVFMVTVGRSSDRHRERRWHLCLPLLMAAGGITLAALFPHSKLLVLTGLVIACMGASTSLPMFWQLPPAFLSDRVQAVGLALISSLGSIASFLAPYVIGWFRDNVQNASLSLYLVAILIVLGASIVLRIPAHIVNPRALH